MENSLAMNVPKNNGLRHGQINTGLPTPSASPGTLSSQTSSSSEMVSAYLEMYDYAGGVTFRGLVVEKEGERALFVFFSKTVIEQDLKPGLTALLELASTDVLGCEQLVVCVDRAADVQSSTDLIKDLGWVGFELTTLDNWSDSPACISDRWIFLSMDV